MSEERLTLPPPVNLGNVLRTVHASSAGDGVYVRIGHKYGFTSVTAREFYEGFASELFHGLLKTDFGSQLNTKAKQKKWLEDCLQALNADAPFKQTVLEFFEANQ